MKRFRYILALLAVAMLLQGCDMVRGALGLPTSGDIEQMKQELQEKEITLSFLRLKVIELLQVLQEMDYIDEKASSYYPKQVIAMTKEICREMIRETDNQVTIEQIVEKYDISIVVFYKVFMQVYGDTPYSYLKKYKMNIAAVKLSEEREKIGDIALELGYSNPSKFSKAFKSVYGVLPKDYRKKHFQKNSPGAYAESGLCIV